MKHITLCCLFCTMSALAIGAPPKTAPQPPSKSAKATSATSSKSSKAISIGEEEVVASSKPTSRAQKKELREMALLLLEHKEETDTLDYALNWTRFVAAIGEASGNPAWDEIKDIEIPQVPKPTDRAIGELKEKQAKAAAEAAENSPTPPPHQPAQSGNPQQPPQTAGHPDPRQQQAMQGRPPDTPAPVSPEMKNLSENSLYRAMKKQENSTPDPHAQNP